MSSIWEKHHNKHVKNLIFIGVGLFILSGLPVYKCVFWSVLITKRYFCFSLIQKTPCFKTGNLKKLPMSWIKYLLMSSYMFELVFRMCMSIHSSVRKKINLFGIFQSKLGLVGPRQMALRAKPVWEPCLFFHLSFCPSLSCAHTHKHTQTHK